MNPYLLLTKPRGRSDGQRRNVKVSAKASPGMGGEITCGFLAALPHYKKSSGAETQGAKQKCAFLLILLSNPSFLSMVPTRQLFQNM